jgi:protein-tyrosine-phosphatase
MIIHFICRGNAFRSRMAETYLNSLEIDGVKAISSGTVAKQHSESNEANFLITQSVLEKHGLKKYTKANWDQLNKERLLEADITIFLNDNVRKECQKLFGLPTNYKVWDIPDFDEITPIPTTKQEIQVFTERIYGLVVSKVNDLSNILLK